MIAVFKFFESLWIWKVVLECFEFCLPANKFKFSISINNLLQQSVPKYDSVKG
jgi:hypothetical protein